MPTFLIMAHAPLASAMKKVAEHAYPECGGLLEVFDVPPTMDAEEAAAHAREILDRAGNPEALVFTDVFGATPCFAAAKLSDGAQVKVVVGVNVPMLWRTLCYRTEPLDQLVERALAGATQGVMQLSPSKQQNQTFKPGGNDQGHRHHQQ